MTGVKREMKEQDTVNGRIRLMSGSKPHFENHPDETIMISMNMMSKSDDWSDDTTVGYGQFTNQADQWAEKSFVGSKFSIYGVKGPDQGSFDLYIDGNLNQSVNTNAESRTNHAQLFDIYLATGYSHSHLTL